MDFSPETLAIYPDMEEWLGYKAFPNTNGTQWSRGLDLTLEQALVVIRRLSDKLDERS